MIHFKETLNKHWWKFNHKISNHQISLLDEKLNIDEVIKRNLTEQIRQKISEKIKIEKINNENYDDLFYKLYDPTTEYKTEFIILNKEDLFDLFYSFNQLSNLDKENVFKNISPSEEYYINQVRSDKLESILSEIWNQEIDFPPSSINI